MSRCNRTLWNVRYILGSLSVHYGMYDAVWDLRNNVKAPITNAGVVTTVVKLVLLVDLMVLDTL